MNNSHPPRSNIPRYHGNRLQCILRAFTLPSLAFVVALSIAACAPGQLAPSNPGGLEPAPAADATFTPRPTVSPADATSAPEPTNTPMNDDTVTIDLTNPAPPNQQPLPAGRTRIFGQVLDDRGAPIAGAAVTIPRGTSPVPERAALTDENGNFSWTLLPGIYTVQVNATGFQVAEADANTQQQTEFKLDFTLKPE